MGVLRINFDAARFGRMVNDMKNAKGAIQEGVEAAVYSSLFQVHSIAVQPGYVPIDTGTLRRSITFTLLNASGRVQGAVGSNLVYAAIHEFGGRAGRGGSVNIKAKRYLGRAVEQSKPAIIERFKKIQVLKKR